MKFSTAVLAIAAASSVSAVSFNISEPWGQTTWTAGQVGTVSWSASNVVKPLCEIHLLTGNASDATFVTNFTANGNLVPCNYTKANLHPLPDYASGQYFIRIGPNGPVTDEYAYSAYFNYVGNGTALPDGEASSSEVSSSAAAISAPATAAAAAVATSA